MTVLVSARPDEPGSTARVLRDGERVAAVASYAQRLVITARPRLTEAGPRRIPCAVLLPSGYAEGDGPLPVLMDPYGGPHGQRVAAAHHPHLTSQWFADQGFAVVVADGRGTPGRSPAWEKAILRDLTPTLDDQVEALHALAGRFPSFRTGSRSGAGRTAATWRRGRCCGGRTSSTRPSSGRR